MKVSEQKKCRSYENDLLKENCKYGSFNGVKTVCTKQKPYLHCPYLYVTR